MQGRSSFRSLNAALALVAVAFALSSGSATAATPVLPDLVSDPTTREGLDSASLPGRLVLRFDGFIHNIGPGRVELRGSGPSNGLMSSVAQWVYNDDGSSAAFPQSRVPVIKYETNDSHQHWHFMKAARYSLWDPQHSGEFAPASKVGFCLLDSIRPTAASVPHYADTCRYGQPAAANVVMGLSPGWKDYYDRSLALQWVDVSEVAPGEYVVRTDVDPDGLVKEQNEVNPPGWATQRTVIPGYLARTFARGQVAPVGPSAITLQAAAFGSPAAAQFQIVSPPTHGSLNRPPGTWFSGANVVYTPNAGYRGPDSFTYAARDGTSPFPLHPPAAAVTLQVGSGASQTAVAISGAPSSLYTGTSAQLRASVVNGPSSAVTWKVNGAPGGNAAVGTISPSGLYTAPSAVPAGGTVRVGATSVDGVSKEVPIRIVSPPPRVPAPLVTAAPLSKLSVSRNRRRVAIKVTARRPGRLRIALTDRGRRVRSCRVQAIAGQRATCRFRLSRRYVRRRALRRLRVTASLRVGSDVVAVRRARVR